MAVEEELKIERTNHEMGSFAKPKKQLGGFGPPVTTMYTPDTRLPYKRGTPAAPYRKRLKVRIPERYNRPIVVDRACFLTSRRNYAVFELPLSNEELMAKVEQMCEDRAI